MSHGDRERLRILLGARRELTIVRTMQINTLRALLITGDEADRRLSRGPLSDTQLNPVSRRRAKTEETVEASIRRAEAVGWPSRSVRPARSSSTQGDLVARGLSGVALVTSDAHSGLVDAISATLPGASWQRCRTHYTANLMSVCPKHAWGGVKVMLHSVFDHDR